MVIVCHTPLRANVPQMSAILSGTTRWMPCRRERGDFVRAAEDISDLNNERTRIACITFGHRLHWLPEFSRITPRDEGFNFKSARLLFYLVLICVIFP